MSVASLRRQATLEAASEAETVFGGQARTWAPIASLWINLKPDGHREAGEAGREVLVETATAEARSLGVAARGQRLVAGGPPWRVVAVTPNRPWAGRMTLHLERIWP